MVNYNPNLPQILGQEWVPIRDESVTFSPFVNTVELGHTFTLSSPQTISTGRFYLHEPAQSSSRQVMWVSLYDNENAANVGPIKQVIIPCNAGGVTGTGVTPNFGTVPGSIISPADSSGVVFDTPDGNLKEMSMQFAVEQYAQLLYNKRILAVDFLYAGYGYSQVGSERINLDISELSEISLDVGNSASGVTFDSWIITDGFQFANAFNGVNTTLVNAEPLGETNWNVAGIATPNAPMKFSDLRRLDLSSGLPAASTLRFRITMTMAADGNPDNRVIVTYGALRVTYCEETRIAVATIRFPMQVGMRQGPMQDIATHTTAPTLTAGNYLVTLSAPSLGDLQSSDLSQGASYPLINGIREQYSLTSFDGVQITIPSPVSSAIDETFERTESAVLPQLSLHTSGGGPITEVHAYGRQVVAQVFGSIYAEQELVDTPIGVNREFPFVRFFARRWGNTTVPLTLTGEAGLSGSSVSITPDEFDALPEVIDGWKEVTLRFNTPPTMGTVGTPTWRWTAAGETAGNRWEVLGCSAPAISGMPNSLMTLVPSNQQLYLATYSPPTGDIQELVWMPQGIGSPWVSGSGVQDDTSDAFLIFSQEPPEVTGFEIQTLCQPLTGIGQDCDVDPCCVPSSISFNQITWTQTSMAASGFGYYEMQRMDTVDSEWLTIMSSESVTGTTFNDFEARVGLEASYRIRVVNLYGFEGPWSDTIVATLLDPGVTIGCHGGHLLIFTSNERQDGSANLAYSSVWMDERVNEPFSFPEAGFVQMQPMYDRDYFTAFRPLERGGEQFQRTILVQAAAISPPTLADFRSMRDLCWEPINYVCVRDEDGNRWFSTVQLPNGVVLNNRRLYLATVQIAEVTATPTPVDLADELVTGTVATEICDDSFTCDDIEAEDSFSRSVSDGWGSTD